MKNGKVKTTRNQHYRCKECKYSFLENYMRKAFEHDINERLVTLLKESCGTRSIARILNIAPSTVTRRILRIARTIQKSIVIKGRSHEMDELFTFVQHKDRRICIAYALDRTSKEVVDFRVGRRNQRTLSPVIETLILSESKQIRTDKLNIYARLIPKGIHSVRHRGINAIERKNLTLRTHLKRLNRRTLGFSRNIAVLTAVLKIYFWVDRH